MLQLNRRLIVFLILGVKLLDCMKMTKELFNYSQLYSEY